MARRSAVAASELPPPSPAATGIRLTIVAAPARLDARGCGQARRALRARACRPQSRSPADSAPPRSPRGRRGRSAAARSRPRASRLRGPGPTTSARFSFAGAGALITEPGSSATNSAGSSASARVSGRRPIASSAAAARSRSAQPGERERVRQRLAPVRERRLDDRLDPVEALRQRDAAESDERRVDVRRRPEDGAGDRMEARPAGGELDRAPKRRRTPSSRARRRSGLRPPAAPSRTRARGRAARPGSRRRSASRRCTGGSRRASSACGSRAARSSASASPQCSSTFGALLQLAQVRRERAVELDGVDVAHAFREVAASGRRDRGRSRARRHRAPSSASRPITPRMFSSARKCWPSRFFGMHGHGSEKAAVAFASIRAASSSASSPRAVGERGDRVDDVGGLVRPAAQRLRREVGAVRLGEDPVGGDRSGRLAQLSRLRIGDVAGEGEVPAPLEPGREQAGLREAVHDDRAVVRAEDRRGVVVRRARVDDDRQPELARELELRLEEAALLVLRLGAVVVVEAGLADGDRARVRRAARAARRPGAPRPSPPGAGRSRAPRTRRRSPRRSRARRGTTRFRSRS